MAKEIAQAFVTQFYSVFASNGVDNLAQLYQPTSMLTFDGKEHMGPQNIIAFLKTTHLDFSAKTLDVQPSVDPNALCIFVTGHVKIDGGNPLQFAEFFHLVKTPTGQWIVHNEMFRFIYS